MRNLLLALMALIAFPIVGFAATIDVNSTADTRHGQCQGGVCRPGVSDPDGDGIANPDPQCAGNPWSNAEAQTMGCGLGSELVLILPTLMWLRRRTRLRVLATGIAALALWTAPVVASAQAGGLGRDTVWLLDNLDPDFLTPPFGDALTVFDRSGEVLMTTIGLNHTQMVGGARVLAVEPGGRWALVALRSSGLVRIGAAGETDWTLPVFANSVALGADGYAYVLEVDDTIYGASLLKIDPVSGEKVARVEQPGFDLVVDARHDRIWIVGKDIKAIDSKTLGLEFDTHPIEWVAVSVDYTTDGSAWVAERKYSEDVGENRLLRVSPPGTISNEIPLDGDPSCLAVDRTDDSIWVTTFNGARESLRCESTPRTGPCWRTCRA